MADVIDEVQIFVRDILVDRFEVPVDEFSPDTDLQSMGIDSFGGVEISIALKKSYGVEFVAGEIGVEFTVADIAALVLDKLGEPQSGVR
jgi:acyl carrier protein